MPSLIHLAKLAQNRVEKFGAQYGAFALYVIINYPAAYLYGFYTDQVNNYPYLIMRVLSVMLCIPLLLNKNLPTQTKLYLPIYWYLTLTLAIPLMGIYMLFEEKFSLGWVINFNIGVMIMIMLVDWVMFIILEVIGISLGILLFIALHNKMPSLPSGETINIFFYMYFWIAATGVVFSRNKEQFNIKNLKDKDILNRALEEKVAERTKELTQALTIKTEFLNNISHEIRTPIAAFSMAAESLVEDWKQLDNKKRFAMASLVAGAAGRIKNLAMHLIAATKSQAGSIALAVQNVNLKKLINDFIDEADMLYTKEKNIKIKLQASEDYYANVDPEAITQVLRNLVLNAIKFSPLSSTITISTTKQHHDIKISIRDEGIGIPPDELDEIFTPFYQSSKTKTGAGGVGLGLYIAKQIIEAHRGKIGAQNNSGGCGANMFFTLPKAEKSSKHESSCKRGVVLVIDDEADMLKSIELTLANKTKHLVITADGGERGLEILNDKSKELDLVLLDIMMPGMDGFEVLKIIRRKWPWLRVIMQSGTSDKEAKNKALKLGAIAFLAKPYKAIELIELINQNL